MPRGPIVLLTDFGTRDWYVAALKGVLAARAPAARIIDLTHEVPPQDVATGAFLLSAASPWFPRGTIFVAVVDPGVGSRRRLLAVASAGRYFLGPDNGLLALSLQHDPRARIIELTNRRFWLTPVSRTFHGRDILAPVAAHLARGVALHQLGLRRPSLQPLPRSAARRHGRGVTGVIIHIDAFGNLITNLDAAACGVSARVHRCTVQVRRRRIPVVSSYADGRPGQPIAVVNSLGLLEVAVFQGSAAGQLRARRGDRVELRRIAPR